MTIDEKVRRVAENALPEWTFVFDNWDDADRTISKAPLPAVIQLLPFGGTLTERNGRQRNSQEFSVAFVDKAQKDADGDDQSEVYSRMVQAAAKFQKALNASGWFEPVTDVRYTVIYMQLSSIITGVYIDVTLTELDWRCE